MKPAAKTASLSVFTDRIHLSDCLSFLKQLPDNSIDSAVTDPPYGLGTREPTSEDIIRYLKGDSLDTGGDFMGEEWEIPSVAVWREVYRVLKPGAYVLAFAGTRTFDIMSIGIRAAGFENRDTVASVFGTHVLSWVHSQGFPKSLNIAKAIRKLEGVENVEELAKQWEGWGTSLKPSWEPIICFRKPVEGTIAEQVVESGTGGINIDASRVKHANAADLESHKAMVAALKAKGGSLGNSWKNSSDLSGANEVKEGGRWPANVVFVHADGCKKVGTEKVAAPVINRFDDGMKPFGDGAGHAYTSTQTGDAEGKEEVPVYECVPGCPIKKLNEQSGRDTGGASRFFVQFMPDAPFFYSAKASRTERNKGFPPPPKSKAAGKRKKITFYKLKDDFDVDLYYEQIHKHLPEDFDPEADVLESLEFEERIPEEVRSHFEVAEPVGNNHPTVKPVALMRYLVRLVTPKGGVTLDPYCGSGTTCQAAVEEGCHFIGIERDEEHHKTATTRVMTGLEAKKAEDNQSDLSSFLSDS